MALVDQRFLTLFKAMKYTNNTIKYFGFALVAIIAVFGVFMVTPTPVDAISYGDYYHYGTRPVYTYDLNYYNAYVYSPPVSYPSPVSYYPNPPVYYPPVVSYPALQVSCHATPTSVRTGDNVQWYATVSGGTGQYTYNWSGTDGLYGYSSVINKSYHNPGYKTATVTITSGNQTITRNCNNSVNVQHVTYVQPIVYPQPVYTPVPVQYPVPTMPSLSIGCFADPNTININQPVTWIAEVTGGMAPYTYSWTGSDGLTGNQSSVIKYYGTSGSKSAIVTVTSADGSTASRACTNTITVRSATPVYKAPVQPVTPTAPVDVSPDKDSDLSASALFSLKNVPWGWVAILIILVLFFMVIYLIFNRKNI